MNIKSDDGIRQELNIDKRDIIVGHVGRLMDAKNHSFLLDIVSEMINKNPNIKCILVGDGILREQIEEKILKLNIQNNVYLLGIRDDVDKIMKEFDLFIMPSIYEGLGLVLLEAQVSIVPCLVSEAIQPEADLGVGLVKQLNLSDGIHKWAEEAEKIISNKNKNNINIDYFPTNFIVQDDLIWYVDYECNEYMEQWNFENWGIKYWSKTAEFIEHFQSENK